MPLADLPNDPEILAAEVLRLREVIATRAAGALASIKVPLSAGRPPAAIAAVVDAAATLIGLSPEGVEARFVVAAARAARLTLRANNARRSLRAAVARGLLVRVGGRVYLPSDLC